MIAYIGLIAGTLSLFGTAWNAWRARVLARELETEKARLNAGLEVQKAELRAVENDVKRAGELKYGEFGRAAREVTEALTEAIWPLNLARRNIKNSLTDEMLERAHRECFRMSTTESCWMPPEVSEDLMKLEVLFGDLRTEHENFVITSTVFEEICAASDRINEHFKNRIWPKSKQGDGAKPYEQHAQNTNLLTKAEVAASDVVPRDAVHGPRDKAIQR